MDRFNLTGLNTEVQYYQHALDLVTDAFDVECDDKMRDAVEKSARHLYGLVHARYIVTTRGLARMVRPALYLTPLLAFRELTRTPFATSNSSRSTKRPSSESARV